MTDHDVREMLVPLLREAKGQGAAEVLGALTTFGALAGRLNAPAARPAAVPPPSRFPASRARFFGDHFDPDARGDFPEDMHRQFGMGPKAFADATGLKLRGRGNRFRWFDPYDRGEGEFDPDKRWEDEEPIHFAAPPVAPLRHPDEYLSDLSSPGHALTRAGGDHPDADHAFRGEAADALQQHGREYEASILRDRDRHVTVDKTNRVVPARFTLAHVRGALVGAPVGLGASWPGSSNTRLGEGDQPFAVVHAPKAVPAVVHAAQVPGALADRLAQLYTRNPDGTLPEEAQRRVDEVRATPVEEADPGVIHEYGHKPNWRVHGTEGAPKLGAELEVSAPPQRTDEQAAREEAKEQAKREYDAAYTAWYRLPPGSPESEAARVRVAAARGRWESLPERGPRGTPLNKPFFGTRGHLRHAARQTLDKLNAGLPGAGFAVLKGDSSIQGKGFEIVTHPATLDVHKERWPAVLGQNNEAGLASNSEQYGTGLHVHIGRDALTPLGVHKMLQFVHGPANTDYVEAVARRKLVPAYPGALGYAKLVPGSKKPADALKRNADRYEAVNLQNAKTVELRLFGGTLDPHEFFTSLEFADALAHFSRAGATGTTDVGATEPFMRFVSANRKRYPHLHAFNQQFAAKKGLPTNFADDLQPDGFPPIQMAVALGFAHPGGEETNHVLDAANAKIVGAYRAARARGDAATAARLEPYLRGNGLLPATFADAPNLRDQLTSGEVAGRTPTADEVADHGRAARGAAEWAATGSHPAEKAARGANRFRDVARRRRVIAGIRSEKLLADGIGAHHLPDSEPGDVIHMTDPTGKVITDPGHVRRALRVRARMVESLADPNTDAGQRAWLEKVLADPVHVFEVKTLLKTARNYVQMNPRALAAKRAFADRYRANFHTVAIDRRRGAKHSGHEVYVAPNTVAPTTNLAGMKKAATMAAVLEHVRNGGAS